MTIAYYCVLAAGLLPYVAAVLAKAGAMKPEDNAAPREFLGRLEGWRQRANWGQSNSFEAFPLFAASVVIAHQVGAPQGLLDQLAIAFVVLRLVYIGLYVANLAALRSLVWFGGLAIAVGLFFI